MADMTPLVLEIKANTSSATASIRKLKSEMSGLGRSMNVGPYGKGLRSIGKDAKWAGKQIGSALAAPMKNLTKNITNTVGAIGKLGAAFKRILFYRAIRSMIREIGDAFKYGVNNLYAWSSGVGGQFAASMNQIATAFAYFKNSVGAAVAPLINALAPAIDFVIDKAVTLLNVINQLFARLTGQTYWTRATKQATAYGGAVKSAGGAAKEALRYLAPFDELNVLPSNSGGGGGGGSGGAGASGLFEDVVEFDKSINDLFELINNNKFFEAGQLLADKVGEIVDSLDAKITSADFRNKILGTLGNITEIINGFFYELTFEDGTAASIATRIGNLVGDAAGLALESIHVWLSKIEWKTIGVSIGQFINGGIESLRKQKINLGQIVADLINREIHLLSGIVTTVNWESVGSWIAENINTAISNIDWSEMLSTIRTTLRGLLTAFKTALKDIKWGEIVSTIGSLLVDSDLWVSFAGLAAAKFLGGLAKSLGTLALGKASIGGVGAALGVRILGIEASVLAGLVIALRNALKDPNTEYGKAESAGETYGTYTEALAAALKRNAALAKNHPDSSYGYEAVTPQYNSETKRWYTEGSSLSDAGYMSVKEWLHEYTSLPSGWMNPEDVITWTQIPTEWNKESPTFNVPVTAEVTSINQKKLKEKDRKISKIQALINEATEGKGYTAPLIAAAAGIEKAKQAINYKTPDIQATGSVDHAHESGKFSPVNLRAKGEVITASQASRYTAPTIDAKAGFIDTVKSKLTAAMTTLNSTANYIAIKDSRTAAQKSLASTANYNRVTDSRTVAQKTLASIAKYSGTSDARSVAQKTLASIAKYSYSTDALTAKQKTVPVTATIVSKTVSSSIADAYGRIRVQAVATISNVASIALNIQNAVKRMFGLASGGVLTGNTWKPIQSFASGGFPGGQIFRAREAGPELVGTLKGHTAVMNNDQIVASVSAGVARAISNIEFHMNGVASVPIYNQENYDEDTLYRAFLRALNDADISNDTYLDGEKIYDSTVRYNQRRTRMTGVNAMA